MKTIKFIGLLILVSTFFLYLCFKILINDTNATENMPTEEYTQPNITSDITFEDMDQQEMIENLKPDDTFCAVSAVRCPNNELQSYNLHQVKIENDHIKITADKNDGQYISGKAESTIYFRYGTFTFQVNTVKGKGLFPAIWMLPADGNPYPEIDIYELIGNEQNRFYGVLHYLKDGEKNRLFFEHEFSPENIPETYLLRFEWTPEKMAWYLNNEELYSIQQNVPDQHMYMIINLAVGGNWPGDPDENTKFPAEFDVHILDFKPQEVYFR